MIWEEKMAEQVCPHCRRAITPQNLSDFERKLQEEAVEKEFEKSGDYKRFDKAHIVGSVLLFGAVIWIVVFALLDPGSEYLMPYEAAFILFWMLLGMAILHKLGKKQKALFKQFKLKQS